MRLRGPREFMDAWNSLEVGLGLRARDQQTHQQARGGKQSKTCPPLLPPPPRAHALWEAFVSARRGAASGRAVAAFAAPRATPTPAASLTGAAPGLARRELSALASPRRPAPRCAGRNPHPDPPRLERCGDRRGGQRFRGCPPPSTHRGAPKCSAPLDLARLVRALCRKLSRPHKWTGRLACSPSVAH